MTQNQSHLLNVYEHLGLDPDSDVGELARQLTTLEEGWARRASRGGAVGTNARETLDIIRFAREKFADEDEKEAYDLALRRADAPDEPASVDWLARSWSYYYLDDLGAAEVAARKAREQDPTNELTWAVSAWVQLKQDEVDEARKFADEAFVLTEEGASQVDVYHVRGSIALISNKLAQAVKNLTKALKGARDVEASEISRKLAVAHYASGHERRTILTDIVLPALAVELPHELQDGLLVLGINLLHSASEEERATGRSTDPIRQAISNYRELITLVKEGPATGQNSNVLTEFMTERIGELERMSSLITGIQADSKITKPPAEPGSGPVGLAFTLGAILAVGSCSANLGWGNFGTGIGLFFLFGFLGLVAGAVVYGIRKSTHNRAIENYEQAQERIAKAESALGKARSFRPPASLLR